MAPNRLGGLVGVLFGFVLVGALALAAIEVLIDVDLPLISRGGLGDPTAGAARQETLPGFEATDVDVDGALTVVGPSPAPHRRLTVAVDAPAGVEAMQLADNPSFLGASWRPIAPRALVVVPGVGDQVVFGRFRFSDGSVTATTVVGATVDPTWEAAISGESGAQEVAWVGPFSAGEVVLRVEAGRVVGGSLEPYDLDEPPPGDEVGTGATVSSALATPGAVQVVSRDGEVYGFQVSQRSDVIRRPDRLVGTPIDGGSVADGPWTVTSADDGVYGRSGRAPVEVRYLARPTDGGIAADLEPVVAMVHDFVLSLPVPLQPGATYTFAGPDLAPVTWTYDPATVRSPAVRVNQRGYAPDDGVKAAYLGGWFDGIGSTAISGPRPRFSVVRLGGLGLDTDLGLDTVGDIDAGSGGGGDSTSAGGPAGVVVLTGGGTLRPGGNEAPMGERGDRGDLTGSPVYGFDFSEVTEPGTYRVCVDEVGCSHRFEISPSVWSEMTMTVARGLYHQRSGIELGPPYTPVVRPRPHHPADGIVVEATDYSLLEAQSETANTDFERLVDESTGRPVDGAWGGHMDAGDWDRRINHLTMASNLAQALLAFPELADLELNIPESGDEVPDLLDEALWSVDLYRRLQADDGSVRGGIESSAHPPANATSWVDDLALYAYEPDVWSTYVYAGAAAQVAAALVDHDRSRSDDLLDSALDAMAWAEAERRSARALLGDLPGPGGTGSALDGIEAKRNVAAAALLLATGRDAWHEVFVDSADWIDADEPNLSCHAHTRCDGAWLYLQTDESLTDSALRAIFREHFRSTAEAAVAQGASTAYGFTSENPFVPFVWGLGAGGTPHVSGLLRAFVLTGEERYRNAAVRSVAVSLGANPMNRSLVTGIGEEPVRHPQINDIKNGGLATWPGTPVYGFHTLDAGSTADPEPTGADAWVVRDVLNPAGTIPDPRSLPYLWQWYDLDSVAQFNEFTVHQSHGESLLAYALLAATSGR